MVTFPAFRSEEWMREMNSKVVDVPKDVLENAELHPKHMQRFPSAHMYAKKAADVREQIRRALFRQAVFKIQNVEVVDDCKENRSILGVSAPNHSSLDLWSLLTPEHTTLIRDEIWQIERCKKVVEYRVSYFKEGDDGFSTRVIPESWTDRFRLLRFYYF